MREETKVLIDSLQAVSRHADTITQALMLGQMTPEKQRNYADMLHELADLLCEHADLQEGRGAESE